MRFTLLETRVGLRGSSTRIPFRYGSTCLSRCPQVVVEATIEAGGVVQSGHSGDCLPPGWFDKSPGLTFERQIADMLESIAQAEAVFREVAARPVALFPAWREAYRAIQGPVAAAGGNGLLAGFGLSLVERALMDAACRAAGMSFGRAVREDLFAIEAGTVHPELAGWKPADWLPAEPLRAVWERHTVGLGDALTVAEIPAGERVDDGLPQALEEHIDRYGVRYFKVKLSGDQDRDVDRLLAFARLVEGRRGADYRLTLDGNEQYRRADDFDALIGRIEGTGALDTLRSNVIAIEQPLERSIALDPAHTAGIRELERWRPVIIDESDGTLESYARALELGYRGVSSKNCKGPIKSLLNAGLTWARNRRDPGAPCLMTGEDLCSVGVIPVQADLCLAATLGLEHVERNGHHYHPGLSYLPEPRRREALAAHPDFYGETAGIIGPAVREGQFAIGSIVDAVGFGFAARPDWADWTAPGDWSYASLGLETGQPMA